MLCVDKMAYLLSHTKHCDCLKKERCFDLNEACCGYYYSCYCCCCCVEREIDRVWWAMGSREINQWSQLRWRKVGTHRRRLHSNEIEVVVRCFDDWC